MTTPEVRAACADLREDATKWSAAAEALRGASQVAAGLMLVDKLGQIPQLAGSGKSLVGYDEFRRKATTALGVGAGVFDDIATVLRQVADAYEREDVEGAHAVAKAGEDR